MEVFIIWRSGRAVVSCAFNTPRMKRGYEPAVNWRDLEPEARRIKEEDKAGGPHIWACPAGLALRAKWSGQVEQVALFDEALRELPGQWGHP
jgi:hypothetical protein